MKNKRDKAIEYFSQKMHCSQAVLAAFSEECGISEEQAFKLGSCFGSGMRKGEVCGACTGALMAFQEANGSYICNDLLGYDISTPEGAQRAREDGLFVDLCPKMVASAVDILERIIKELKE